MDQFPISSQLTTSRAGSQIIAPTSPPPPPPQAIAAMAWGTATCPKVDKVLGPGNQYVTAAKMLLQV